LYQKLCYCIQKVCYCLHQILHQKMCDSTRSCAIVPAIIPDIVIMPSHLLQTLWLHRTRSCAIVPKIV
jgi:hypothetical protein